jgi:signal transduction histidine kinase/ABC-type uncharacterized transport system substrate-binding protein
MNKNQQSGKRFGQVILILLSIFCLCHVAQGQESDRRRILVLNSYHKGFTWTDNIVKGLESVLKPTENGFDFIVEYMDSKAIVYDVTYKKMLYDLYAHKYANQTFDVIISTDDNALNFLREYHGELFPHVPVVFYGVNNIKVPDLVDRNIFTGIMEVWAAKKNVELILALHPQTRQIVVINGNTPSSEYQWKRLEPIFSEFDNIDIKRLDSAFSIVEIKDYLRRLPEESVVLYLAIFRDKTGTYYGHKDALERISKVNSRPIYGLHAQALSHGIVGGKLLAGYYQGQETGRMASMLLEGQRPNEIPIVAKDNNQYMFDYVELERWHIDFSDLPKGSIIVNEPASIFREHKPTVLLSLLVFIILSIFIILLAFNIKRRKQSEMSLIKAQDGLEIEVIDRTSALRKANEDLTVQIAERTLAKKALGRQNDINLALAEISSAIISVTTIDEVCELVLNHAKKLTGSQFGYVGYIDPVTGSLQCPSRTTEGWEKCQIDNKRGVFKKFTCLFGWVLTEGKPLLCNDPANDSRSKGTPEGHISIEKFLSVPAILQEKVVGQIAIANPGRDYIEDDLELLTKLAPILAAAIQHWHAEEELREAKKEADSANQAKSDFLANMSHELRTPLNVMLGFNRMMSKIKKLPEEYYEKANIIKSSGEQLLGLINHLLDFSKIEAGYVSMEENDFDFYSLLDELRSMFQTLIVEKGLELQISCASEVPRLVLTDQTKLRQVLINLLTNAVNFTETGSVSLIIDTVGNKGSSPQTFIQFKVVDTGPGINSDEVSQLFKAFVQTESGKKSQQGTGLGLAISQQFVKLMGGVITVSSEPGSGATFSFNIPVRVPTGPATGEYEPYSSTQSLKSSKITRELAQKKQLASVAALPTTIISELKEAATYCEVDGISKIITEIHKQDDDLADKLEKFLKEFDFDGILAFLGEDS